MGDLLMSTSRLRILVVSHAWYGDLIGGAFRLASEFAISLAESGHRVSFVCCDTRKNGAISENARDDGLTLHRYEPPSPQSNGFMKLRFHIQQTEQLVRRLHFESNFEVISGHSPLQMLGALRATDRRVFSNYTVHSPFDDELAGNGRLGFMSRLAVAAARQVDRRICQRCDRLQTDSEFTLRVMQNKHGKPAVRKGIVAPGWVESDRFLPSADRRSLRKSIGGFWDTDRPLFFTLRRLENRMGLEDLVMACHHLKEQGLPFRTIIGGGGSLRESLQKLISSLNLQNDVLLAGRLPEEDLPASYAAADCFVLPTRALECFGLIVLEAFSCRTPVIASRAAAIPELAERPGSGWLFEPGDVAELVSRMQMFIEGNLKPTVDLRSVALEYDKAKILRRWEELLTPEIPIS